MGNVLCIYFGQAKELIQYVIMEISFHQTGSWGVSFKLDTRWQNGVCKEPSGGGTSRHLMLGHSWSAVLSETTEPGRLLPS